MLKPYQYYLFDADGTLLDTNEMIYQCFQNTLKVFGAQPVSIEIINSHVGLPFRVQVEKYLGPLTEQRFAEVFKVHNDYQMEIYQKYLTTCPGVIDGLKQLKQADKKLAIVTSRMRSSLQLYLKFLELVDFFEFAICHGETEKSKPDGQPAQRAMEKLQARPEQTLFIGDAIYDADCANAAGIDFAYVNYSHIPLVKFPIMPMITINNISELL